MTLLVLWLASGALAAAEARYSTVEIPAAGEPQKALWWAPQTSAAVPLVVALHSWSGDYQQADSEQFLQRAATRGWAAIHPDFRGPNVRPQAGGSDEAVADVLAAVEFARRAARIDPKRIYLAGSSGGGYMSLLMAARHPEVWAAVTAWVPISDLARWHDETAERKLRYAGDLESIFGGPPSAGGAILAEYKRRSPLGQLSRARGLPIDINAGIHDGHTGSVPIAHSLVAFNELASANGASHSRVSGAWIEEMMRTRKPPSAAPPAESDPTYSKPVLFRRQAGPARVTIFEGGHEMLHDAAFAWLERQRRP
jgi:pimeloyl-ACP methyl ester carboxylesterase